MPTEAELIEAVKLIEREGGSLKAKTVEYMDDDPDSGLVVFRDEKGFMVCVMNADDYKALLREAPKLPPISGVNR